MKLIVIGSHLCQHTWYALMKLKENQVTVDFRNISTDFAALKEFMRMREQEELFTPVKEQNKLGIPFFILEDGTKTVDLQKVIEKIVGKDKQDGETGIFTKISG